jgi:ribonucleoside-diphosphate reductase alpha chain
LADALIMCGSTYGSADAVARAGRWMAAVQRAAYLASSDLAAEKGSFPAFDAAQFLARPHVQTLDADVRTRIAAQGLRNGCLTSIAPTGTISVLEADGTSREEVVEDYAHRLHDIKRGQDAPRSAAFVTAAELTPEAHLVMQAAVQRHVDSSISKTINCPADLPFDAFAGVYLRAYDLGLKGCTTFRPNAITGSILEPLSGGAQGSAAPGLAEPSVQFSAAPTVPGRICSQCHDVQLIKQEGCWMCPVCGYSRCG